MKKSIIKIMAVLVLGTALFSSCSVDNRTRRYGRYDRYHHDRYHDRYDDHHYRGY
ncbi:hypothetical protein [Mucilaginibacter conchicola]|uniref:hypothetical protein n=1 Tax=Mucilaginibacter conchicola TaxID=2303333 RepID=UPI001313F2E5|nr:hypothetical protein [Mucilaginibacter conchicola]